MSTEPRPVILPPGGGKGYEWSADHTFVKVGAADTGGAYALLEDNLKPGFRLGLHLHRTHAETFYILTGPVWFWLAGAWHGAEAGACIHIPPGTPHAVELPKGGTGRMLMIYQPSGFDAMLAEMAGMTEAEFADPAAMARMNDRYDIVPLGDAPPR
ncbi:MAG: cupin domain-containing protein [Paracoccaceae bacterium]